VKPGFPAQRRVKLVYSDTVSLTGATGVIESHQYRLNSAFDPDYTSAGHQPLAYDQWSAFYNHYVVMGCTWEVSVISGNTQSMILTSAYVSDDETIPSFCTSLQELGGDVQASNVYLGSSPITHVGSVTTAEFFNRDPKAIASDPNLRATVSGNPTEVLFLSLSCQSPSSTSHTTEFLVRLVYDVVFMEPKDLGNS